MNRREFSSALGASLSLAAFPIASVAKELESLSQIGLEKGIDIGSAYNGGGNAKLKNILLRQCSILTPENSLKPANVAPTKTYRNFDPAKAIYDYCIDNGKKFHGHTLYWHRTPIRWAEADSFEQVKKLYGGFIRDVVGEFPKANSWDVFNEIFEEKTLFRNAFLIRKYGLNFIEFCLKETKEAAPDAKLVINDYNLSCAGNWCSAKQNNVLSVIRKLKKRGAPLDAIGIQGHLSSKYKPSPKKTLRFIKKLEAMGLEVHLSELDVNDINFSKSVAKRDRQVASYYHSFLSQTLRSKAVKRVTFWGISDASNWITRGQAGTTIKGASARPALFDSNNEPKPAFYSVLKALKAAPFRIELISTLNAQITLKKLNYDPGIPDGVWGRKSTLALNTFRKSLNLAPVSRLDITSQKLLLKYQN